MDEKDSLQQLNQFQQLTLPKDSIQVNVSVNVQSPNNSPSPTNIPLENSTDTLANNGNIKEQITASVHGSWEKITNKISGWGEDILLNLPNFILAALVFALAYWLSNRVKQLVLRISQHTIQQASIRDLLANFSSIIVIAIGFLIALNVLNLNEVLTSLLAGAGVAGLAIGLALQGTLANTFSGIFLAVRDVISIGDWIESNGFSGTVMSIDLRNTQLKEADNNIVVIPNQMILDNPFKNYGLTQRVRATITCGVGYECDLEEVKAVAIEAISALYPPNDGEEVELHYLEFGASSVNFRLRFWVNSRKALKAFEAKSEAIMALRKAFDEHNINIPFPIRTVFHQNGNTVDKQQEAFELEEQL
jgi:small conductance mechanosensitive channel